MIEQSAQINRSAQHGATIPIHGSPCNPAQLGGVAQAKQIQGQRQE